MNQATALRHISELDTRLQDETLPPHQENFCEIKSLYSLISIGTERLVAKGLVPQELWETMRVPYMGGRFSFPVKYGYSLVGKVVTDGHSLFGKTVHLLHPHQNRCQVTTSDLFVIPSGIPPKRAALASNLETAVTAVWDAWVSVGDRVLVVGFGLIGSLVARLLSFFPGVEVAILEKDKNRKAVATEMGFQTQDSAEGGGNFDLAFHTTGSGEGLQSCVDLVGKEGKIIELSWYGKREVMLALGGSFHSMRKQIISSQVGSIPSSKIARWNFNRRKKLVFELLKKPLFDQHISQTLSFEEAPAFFDKLRKANPPFLSCCLKYDLKN